MSQEYNNNSFVDLDGTMVNNIEQQSTTPAAPYPPFFSTGSPFSPVSHHNGYQNAAAPQHSVPQDGNSGEYSEAPYYTQGFQDWNDMYKDGSQYGGAPYYPEGFNAIQEGYGSTYYGDIPADVQNFPSNTNIGQAHAFGPAASSHAASDTPVNDIEASFPQDDLQGSHSNYYEDSTDENQPAGAAFVPANSDTPAPVQLNDSTGQSTVPGVQNSAPITLKFANYNAAKSGIKPLADWMPPSPDKTIPQTDANRQRDVLRLLCAMKNMDDTKDQKGAVYKSRWQSSNASFYDADHMEKVCWDIVHKTEELQRYGPRILDIHDHVFHQAAAKTQNWTYRQRIDTLEEILRDYKSRCDKLIRGGVTDAYVATPGAVLQSCKTNRTQNTKRQDFMLAGRKKIAEGAGADSIEFQPASAPVPARRGRPIRVSRAASKAQDQANGQDNKAGSVLPQEKAPATTSDMPPLAPSVSQNPKRQRAKMSLQDEVIDTDSTPIDSSARYQSIGRFHATSRATAPAGSKTRKSPSKVPAYTPPATPLSPTPAPTLFPDSTTHANQTASNSDVAPNEEPTRNASPVLGKRTREEEPHEEPEATNTHRKRARISRSRRSPSVNLQRTKK